MRRVGIWIIPVIGGLLLTGAALAQSPDDEEQGRDYQAPGVHVWKGQLPSKMELHSAVAQARAQGKRLAPSGPDTPDFQNGRVSLYIGRLPKPESLRNMLGSGGGGR